jgi:hypothetical protein
MAAGRAFLTNARGGPGGVAEFFIIHYNDPASYAKSWGGPSLAGVFAVHSGPAVAIVAGAAIYVRRRRARHAS